MFRYTATVAGFQADREQSTGDSEVVLGPELRAVAFSACFLFLQLKSAFKMTSLKYIDGAYYETASGIPVHLKGGVKDVLLYRATVALTVFGLTLYKLLDIATPKKNQ